MTELMEHQVRGIEFLREHPRAAIFDEPGLGKSAQMLLSAKEPVLVVAPAMVLGSGVWDDEIEKWTPGIDATQVAYSSIMTRGKNGRIDKDQFGYATNPPKPELLRPWGTIIADESHYVTNRKTSWTTALLKLMGYADEVKIATGTPLPNWAHEAFSSLQAMYPEKAHPGKELGSYWRWVNEWFEVSSSFFNAAAKEIGGLRKGVTWEEFNEQNWGDRYIRRLRQDCLDLPPLTEQLWQVDMPDAQKRAYKGLKRDFVTWLENGEEIAAWSSAGQMVKLLQSATGVEVLDPAVRSSGKLEALRTILTDRPLPTLVVAHFRASVRECARVASEVDKTVAVVHGGVPMDQREQAVRAFQRGEVDVLCSTIDTIREGVTLHQGGADQVVRVERSFLPSRNDQVVRRLHRLGLTRPVTCIDLVTKGTYEEKMLKMLQEKTDEQVRALRPRDLLELVA